MDNLKRRHHGRGYVVMTQIQVDKSGILSQGSAEGIRSCVTCSCVGRARINGEGQSFAASSVATRKKDSPDSELEKKLTIVGEIEGQQSGVDFEDMRQCSCPKWCDIIVVQVEFRQHGVVQQTRSQLQVHLQVSLFDSQCSASGLHFSELMPPGK